MALIDSQNRVVMLRLHFDLRGEAIFSLELWDGSVRLGRKNSGVLFSNSALFDAPNSER